MSSKTSLTCKNRKFVFQFPKAYENTKMVRINYAVGIGLYMIPSNLVLQVGVIQKYNNNLVIADDSTEIGGNKDINPVDTAAAVNRLDSAEALNPVDSAAKQNSTGISPAERETGIAFVVLFFYF